MATAANIDVSLEGGIVSSEGDAYLSTADVSLLYVQGALIAWVAHMYGRVHGALGHEVGVSAYILTRSLRTDE